MEFKDPLSTQFAEGLLPRCSAASNYSVGAEDEMILTLTGGTRFRIRVLSSVLASSLKGMVHRRYVLQIFNEDTKEQTIEVVTAPQLAEQLSTYNRSVLRQDHWEDDEEDEPVLWYHYIPFALLVGCTVGSMIKSWRQ